MVEPRITRDRDNIETWADEHDTVPVREGDQIRLVRESELTANHERLDWETFHREVEEGDRVVTYHGGTGDREPFEVSNRGDVLDRVSSESADFDRDEAEQRLIEGETITGTITETTVVEETIVEKATVVSEVVDREVTEQNVVDVQLLDRECHTCSIVTEDADFDYAGAYGTDRFLTDDIRTSSIDAYPFDVSVEVTEDWAVTIEQHNRYTVETDITDVDVSETDQIETQDLDVEIDVDAVHQQLLDSDLVEVDADTREGEVVDTETYDMESEVTEDDVLTTYLTSRRQIQREISDRTRLTTEVIEGELLDREIIREEAVETDLTERDTGEAHTGEVRILPEESDEGKPVVTTSGNQIGVVMDVSDGVAYVDPDPSLTEKIMARLGVDEDEEYYPLREDRIERITDDKVLASTGEFDTELDESNR